MERAALFWFLCNLKRRKLSIPFLLFACCKGFGCGGGRDEITTTKVYIQLQRLVLVIIGKGRLKRAALKGWLKGVFGECCIVWILSVLN